MADSASLLKKETFGSGIIDMIHEKMKRVLTDLVRNRDFWVVWQ